MEGDEVERADVEALLETRRELGPALERELVDGFAERIERVVEQRVAAETERRRSADRSVAAAGPRQLALGIVSLVAFIPLGITLGVTGNLGPLLLVLAAIVAINVAHALQARRP